MGFKGWFMNSSCVFRGGFIGGLIVLFSYIFRYSCSIALSGKGEIGYICLANTFMIFSSINDYLFSLGLFLPIALDGIVYIILGIFAGFVYSKNKPKTDINRKKYNFLLTISVIIVIAGILLLNSGFIYEGYLWFIKTILFIFVVVSFYFTFGLNGAKFKWIPIVLLLLGLILFYSFILGILISSGTVASITGMDEAKPLYSVSDCYSLEKLSNRNLCLVKFAQLSGNASLCDNDDCYFQLARLSGDTRYDKIDYESVDICQLINSESLKKRCYLELDSIRDKEQCLSLIEDSPSFEDECFTSLAKNTKNISLCGDIVNIKHGREDCIRKVNIFLGNISYCYQLGENAINSCITSVAEETKNITLCYTIQQSSSVDNCIGLVAPVVGDISICHAIEGYTPGKQMCYMRFGDKATDPDFCNFMNEVSDQKLQCLISVAWNIQDKSICKKIKSVYYRSNCESQFEY